jgi:hypothetical protein
MMLVASRGGASSRSPLCRRVPLATQSLSVGNEAVDQTIRAKLEVGATAWLSARGVEVRFWGLGARRPPLLAVSGRRLEGFCGFGAFRYGNVDPGRWLWREVGQGLGAPAACLRSELSLCTAPALLPPLSKQGLALHEPGSLVECGLARCHIYGRPSMPLGVQKGGEL